MRQFVVLLVSVTTVVGGIPLRVYAQGPQIVSEYQQSVDQQNPTQPPSTDPQQNPTTPPSTDPTTPPSTDPTTPPSSDPTTPPASDAPAQQPTETPTQTSSDQTSASTPGHPRHFILRTSPEAADAIAARHGLTIVRRDESAAPIYVVTGRSETDPATLKTEVTADGSVSSFEEDRHLDVPETAPAVPTTPAAPSLPDPTPLDYFGATAWTGYAFQTASAIIRASDAHRDFGGGAGVIAVIDSGIDINHPALAGSFVEGYDFLTDSAQTTSDTGTLQQSTASILEYTSPDPAVDPMTTAQVNQSTAAILEQSTAAILESEPLPEGFGHGTMVAGLIRLVAPTAKIMPLRVFKTDGTGDVYDVVRAIYYAVDHGATVINMSFSLADWSEELVRALNYAVDHRVVCVASAGNAGKETIVFPAGFRHVIGVGSTDSQDRRSTFSNFGRGLVRMSAPGEGLVTTFPGNHYALVSGTSFSSALVSGAAALLLQRDPTLDPEDVDDALARVGRPRNGALAGDLRLDLYYALLRIRQ